MWGMQILLDLNEEGEINKAWRYMNEIACNRCLSRVHVDKSTQYWIVLFNCFNHVYVQNNYWKNWIDMDEIYRGGMDSQELLNHLIRHASPKTVGFHFQMKELWC